MDLLSSILCPCFKSKSRHTSTSSSETELTNQNYNRHNKSSSSSSTTTSTSLSSLYSISHTMSAPTIQIQGLNVKGYGLALVNVSIDQDCAYWEWHVGTTGTTMKNDHVVKNGIDHDDDDDDEDDFFNHHRGWTMKFGVATRKNQDFYHILEANEEDDSSMDNGTALMKSIKNIHNGDTIGIAIQQDDLPMIQFLLNGEPLHDISINRFRGTVYPSIFIGKDQNDDDDDDDDEEDGNYDDVSVRFVWKEDEFKEMSPSVRFKPLMAAIGII